MNSAPNSEQLARLRELVTRDPEIMGGTPVFKGTGIPMDLVADMLAQGATADEILERYPTLNKEILSLAPLYVRTSSPQEKCEPISLAEEIAPQVGGPAFLLLNVGLMAARQEAVETIIATVPDFQPRFQRFLADWQGEDTPWYLAMGELAHYIVESYEQGNTAQFQKLFSTVESVLQNGDGEIQNLISVGLLEDIQNIASHRSFSLDVFRVYLGPQSLIAWDEVNRGMQKVAEWASQQRRGDQPSGGVGKIDLEAALSQVESPELRRIIEQMYRKMP
jgi:uncharacterized protein (DUF433 family)